MGIVKNRYGLRKSVLGIGMLGMVVLVGLLSACGGGGGGGGGGGTTAASDTTAPTTTAAPAVSGTTDTATTLSVTINENGTGYYLVLPALATDPTVAAVQAGTSFTMSANVAATPAISGLTFHTPYTIFFVAKDAANNVQAAVQSIAVTTAPTIAAGYVTQGGLTWMPVTFYYTWANAVAYCTNTTINGVTGWRMPTQSELSALYAAYPSNSSVLTGQGWTLASTWSSTVSVGGHYEVGLDGGGVFAGVDTNVHYVSCVR
jgi:hypothetical protein